MSCGKSLTQCVFDGHFTRETLAKVMTYDHESWEHPLNQYIRQHATEWEKVKHFAKLLVKHHFKDIPKELQHIYDL